MLGQWFLMKNVEVRLASLAVVAAFDQAMHLCEGVE